ncbi:MAG: N-acetylmuramoyl-L-alanine amidase [Candidatus Dormiibacterota bacterium]
MRHHRARSLHILAIAPVAAILAGALGPASHAFAAAPRAPSPVVVTVDPGHGGKPTPSHPNIPLDPGAIGINGLLEKDVDLDVGLRLAGLLRADLVEVVMTRSTDTYVSAARREQVSITHHAALVLSVHAGASSNPRTAGSVVLYPTGASALFAQTVSDALTAQITADGVPDAGFALGDAAWTRSPAPVATVVTGYLSNRADAELMATARFRQDVAIGVRDGVEAYMPSIIARRDAIRAWRSAHANGMTPGTFAPASAAISGTSGFQFGVVIAWLVGIVLVGLVLLFRDVVARVLVVLIALVVRLFGAVIRFGRAVIRRRRRRRRTLAFDDWESRRTDSVYDDIPL